MEKFKSDLAGSGAFTNANYMRMQANQHEMVLRQMGGEVLQLPLHFSIFSAVLKKKIQYFLCAQYKNQSIFHKFHRLLQLSLHHPDDG